MMFDRLRQNLSIMWFSFGAMRKPGEIQNILSLAEILFSSGHLESLKNHCARHCAEMFVDRPKFLPDINRLSALPKGTLGREYFVFLKNRCIDPKDLCLMQKSYNQDELYLFEYFYQTHDLFHLLTGFETDVAGELELQAFYLGQAPTPLAPLLIGLGTLREFWKNPAQAQLLVSRICESYQLGKKTYPLYGVDWERELFHPIEEVRRKFNLVLKQNSDLRAA
jgi:ubiquinone biosynthesis protein COQ4